MGRHDPGTPPDVTPKVREGYITQERSYKLITPLFGGGVEPQNYDPVTVIRATSIRGHLRFWWRATRGGQYTTVEDLKKAEDALWGAASNDKGGGPSKVEVVVRGNKDQPKPRAFIADPRKPGLTVGEPRSPYSYGAFPLNEAKGSVYENIEFTLSITFPDTAKDKLDVDAALWAWETFGGIGARTRRGFGAIKLIQVAGNTITDVPPDAQQPCENWLRERLARYVAVGTWPLHVPHLTRELDNLVLIRAEQDVLTIWRRLLNALKNFRQERPQGRDEQGRPCPGRNHWPEQDEVRRLTGQRSHRHQQVISSIRKFPRAAFGLPLIIQYKHKDQQEGDPRGNNTVNVPGKERFASPLILRPLACTNGYLGIAVLLAGSRVPEQLVIKTARGELPVQSDLSPAEAQMIMCADGVTSRLNGTTDVLRAFLDYLERE